MKKICLVFLLVSMVAFSAGDSGANREAMMETVSKKVASYEKDPVKKKEIKEKKEKEIKIRKKRIENKDWEAFSLEMMMDKESPRK